MDIVKQKTDDMLVVNVTGRLDTSTAPSLEESVKGEFDSIKTLVFDFAGLEYLSSAGLRVILSCQKAMGKRGKMVVRNVNDTIMEIFSITGFSDILTIES